MYKAAPQPCSSTEHAGILQAANWVQRHLTRPSLYPFKNLPKSVNCSKNKKVLHKLKSLEPLTPIFRSDVALLRKTYPCPRAIKYTAPWIGRQGKSRCSGFGYSGLKTTTTMRMLTTKTLLLCSNIRKRVEMPPVQPLSWYGQQEAGWKNISFGEVKITRAVVSSSPWQSPFDPVRSYLMEAVNGCFSHTFVQRINIFPIILIWWQFMFNLFNTDSLFEWIERSLIINCMTHSW